MRSKYYYRSWKVSPMFRILIFSSLDVLRLQFANLNFQMRASYYDAKQFTSKLDDILLCIEQHELYGK